MSRRCGGREAMTPAAPAKTHWPADSKKCVFLARALASVDNARMWDGLVSGRLQAGVIVVGATDFRTPMPVSPFVFLTTTANQIFDTHQIELRDVHPATPVMHRRRIKVPHWVYVTRESLDKFERSPAGGSVVETRGRKRKADQDAAEDALRDEIKRRGWPDNDNADPEWRNQSHVEKWLSELFSEREEAIGESRTREIAVYLLNKLKADN
jgi:hypothetical protein